MHVLHWRPMTVGLLSTLIVAAILWLLASNVVIEDVQFVLAALMGAAVVQAFAAFKAFMRVQKSSELIVDFDSDSVRPAVKLVSEKLTRQEPIRRQASEAVAFTSPRELLKTDKALALASLRMELERALRDAAARHELPERDIMTVSRLVDLLIDRQIVPPFLSEAIREIHRASNQAIHGYEVPDTVASEIVENGEQIISYIDQLRDRHAPS